MNTGWFDVLHQTADHHSTGVIAERININLNGILEVLINQHRVVGFHLHRLAHVAVQFGLIEHHFHRPSAQDIRGAHNDGITDIGRNRSGFLFAACQAVTGLADVQIAKDGFELLAVLGPVNRFRGCTPDRSSCCTSVVAGEPVQQWNGELQRGLTAELDHHTIGLLNLNDIENIFKSQRLEIETVAGVVIGRHRLGVAVHHHCGDALLLRGERGVAAAVIELDALADAIRSTTQNHHLALVRCGSPDFVGSRKGCQRPIGLEALQRTLVGRVVVRRG